MKNLDHLDKYRKIMPGIPRGDSYNGMFEIEIDNVTWKVMASDGGGWDHVSISHKEIMPPYEVMNAIHHMFFRKNELSVQYHVPKSQHINIHEHCLHLWRPQNQHMPQPPSWMVGPRM